MGIKLLINAVGTLFPIIFPKQEFKPKRLAGAVVCVGIAWVSIHFLGVDGTEQLLDVASDVLELTEE